METESTAGGIIAFTAFALLVLSIMATCIIVGLQPHTTTAADITIAPCSMQHIPANTRTDVCVSASGSIVSK